MINAIYNLRCINKCKNFIKIIFTLNEQKVKMLMLLLLLIIGEILLFNDRKLYVDKFAEELKNNRLKLYGSCNYY